MAGEGRKRGNSSFQKQASKKGGLSPAALVIISAGIAVIAYITHTEFSNNYQLRKLLPRIKGPIVENKKWGTYRPHTYFGLRTRDPRSPLFGVMWYEQPDVMQRPHVRHWCNQGDDLVSYGWHSADGRTFGRQNVSEHYGELNFDWINHGESWTANIRTTTKTRYSIIFYLAAQERQSKFRVGRHLRDIITGRTELLGDVKLGIHVKDEKPLLHSSLVWDEQLHLDRLDELILMNTRAMKANRGLVYQLDQMKPFSEGQFVAVQLNFWTDAEMQITFSTSHHIAKVNEDFEKELQKREEGFNLQFEMVFGLQDKINVLKPTQDVLLETTAQCDLWFLEIANNVDDKRRSPAVFSEVVMKRDISRVAKSVGDAHRWIVPVIATYSVWNKNLQLWYHEALKVYIPGASTSAQYGPHELFSAVPSRSYFPRGFLWDEGFHNILIRKFDPELSLEILVSWLNTMSESGWIPREMILGVESEAKVPSEYIVQRTNVANPPSIFYVVDKMLDDEKLLAKHDSTIASMYPRLEKWYKWLCRSQAGKEKGTFRWRGRNATTVLELNPKTMASGLDDYPRASHPSKEEYHLDLRCWMALGSRVMNRLAHLYEEDKNRYKYTSEATSLADFDDLLRLHWSKEKNAFFDYGRHSDKVKLIRKPVKGIPEQFSVERSVVNKPRLGFVDDVFGYNSLFPLMFRLVPHDSEQMGLILDKLVDTELLWTDYGLRSVARSSPYYAARNTEHDPPYWRGYIWINANYMVLSALKHYASLQGPYQNKSQSTFAALRENLVVNMAKEFNRTGYIWENYDDKTGQGRGSHPFNGWSSLILLIMSDDMDV